MNSKLQVFMLWKLHFMLWYISVDRLCGLVVSVSGFDSWRYQIFWEVVGLEQGPLSLMSTIEELLGRNSSGSGLENWEYGHGGPLRWLRDTLYQQKLAPTSLRSGGRSVGIVCLWAKATEFVLFVGIFHLQMCILLRLAINTYILLELEILLRLVFQMYTQKIEMQWKRFIWNSHIF
jgi:hypothetical protein